MSRVEIQIPFDREETLIEAVRQIGGRVMSVQEEPITASGINPKKLLRHLQVYGVNTSELQDLADHSGQTTYNPIFSLLRELPFDRQSILLESFLGHGMRDSKIGTRLGRFLAIINNINWLEPHEDLSMVSMDELQSLSDEFYQQLGASPLPLTLVKDWSALGRLIVDGFTEGEDVTFRKYRNAWVSQLDRQARNSLGAHRDYREVVEARRLVNNILNDVDAGGLWKGRIRELRYWGGEGFSNNDFAKMSAGTAIRADALLVTTSLVLEKHLPRFGYTTGVLAEGLFKGVYDRGYVFIGPIRDQSIIFAPIANR